MAWITRDYHCQKCLRRYDRIVREDTKHVSCPYCFTGHAAADYLPSAPQGFVKGGTPKFYGGKH